MLGLQGATLLVASAHQVGRATFKPLNPCHCFVSFVFVPLFLFAIIVLLAFLFFLFLVTYLFLLLVIKDSVPSFGHIGSNLLIYFTYVVFPIASTSAVDCNPAFLGYGAWRILLEPAVSTALCVCF